MSILDLDKELDLKEYYTDKIVKFFRKNGPNGLAFVPSTCLIESKYLFQICPLEKVVNKPRDYELWAIRVGNTYFLKIYLTFTNEWAGYVPVRMRKKDYLSKVFISDILEV